MNRPDNIKLYDGIDLKLGIKSSLPHVKSTLALAILFWEADDKPYKITYSEQDGDQIIANILRLEKMKRYYQAFFPDSDIFDAEFETIVNNNQLFKSQIEALMVTFELIWKLGKIRFIDESKPASSERTGRIRYEKKMLYSSNMDIIHSLIENDYKGYYSILFNWLGFSVVIDYEKEKRLVEVLSALSEDAIFKLADGDNDVVFNQNGIYTKLLNSDEAVDISGDKEPKGSLRILKSLMSENLNPHVSYENGSVTLNEVDREDLSNYQKRVETLQELDTKKQVDLDYILDAQDTPSDAFDETTMESTRLAVGENVLLYGVPGSGKSWTIEHEYCPTNSVVERVVFHPDYTNGDFIGQIMPVVDEDKQVTYEFVPGPFSVILKDAYLNPTVQHILIVEEINRGNAPAIFGEVFQLLDRKVMKLTENDVEQLGTSEYGITNKNIAKYVYKDERHKVKIPSNLSIVATMNTSDQNVFTLDTAFQRRWNMRLIENNFVNVRIELAEAKILDSDVTWMRFCETINSIILNNKVKMASAEDKRLGVYFVHEDELEYDKLIDESTDTENIFEEYNELLSKESKKALSVDEDIKLTALRIGLKRNRRFPEKVIKYLWDDAFKFNPEALFETSIINSLEDAIRIFVFSKGNDRFKIFKQNVRDLLTE